jgi:DNA-directed RNA polymerase subunit RPC12/RpoP
MNYCPHCGHKLDGKYVICPKCARRLLCANRPVTSQRLNVLAQHIYLNDVPLLFGLESNCSHSLAQPHHWLPENPFPTKFLRHIEPKRPTLY